MDNEFEKRILRRVSIGLWVLILLVVMLTMIFSSQGNDTRYSVYKATSMVTQIYVEDFGISTTIVYLLALAGKVIIIFIVYILVVMVNEGLLIKSVREGRLMKKVASLNNHYIVCGGGRVGMNAAIELKKVGVPFVIIERDGEIAKDHNSKDLMTVPGDSLEDETLNDAGIKKAKVLIACLNSDGDNMLQIITAKRMNPKLRIIARANYEKFVENLKNVGADKVILPEVIGGIKLAEAALKT